MRPLLMIKWFDNENTTDTEYIQTTELSYDAFCSLPEPEQVKLLAKSGKFYQKFWQYYIILFDGHIIEDEATVIGMEIMKKVFD